VPEVVAVDGLPHVPPPRNMASCQFQGRWSPGVTEVAPDFRTRA
jgi:hypothetical protein